MRELASLVLISALAVHLGPAGVPSLEATSPTWVCGPHGVVVGGGGLCAQEEPAAPALSAWEDPASFPEPHRRDAAAAGASVAPVGISPQSTRDAIDTRSPCAFGARLLGLSTHPANAPPLRG